VKGIDAVHDICYTSPRNPDSFPKTQMIAEDVEVRKFYFDLLLNAELLIEVPGGGNLKQL
jgi:hypothetical protein